MAGMIVRRLLATIPILLLVSFGVFMLSSLLPGDPAVTLAGGANATEERIEEVRIELGLDKALVPRYVDWLGDAARLDFGTSIYSDRSTVTEEVRSRIPVTFGLSFLALGIGLVIGIPAGILSGMKPGGVVDRTSVTGTSLGIAIPNFFLAMVLVTVFAVQLDWLPALGFTRFTESPTEWLRSLALPAIALGLFAGASVARQLRAALIDVMSSNYVRTAWAMGGSARTVVGKHALKNAAFPAVTVIGLQLGALLGGSVIIESIFSIPGLGSYLLRALVQQDVPVIQGVVVVFVLIQVGLTLLIDITYGLLNPKVRVS